MSGRREKNDKEKQYETKLKQIFAKRFKTACQKKFNKNQNDEIGTKELFEIFKYVYPERAKLYINDKNSAVPTLRKWLNGESIPEYSALLKLCDEECLNCSVDYLFGRIECTKHDKQFIHDKTRLSEQSIDVLCDSENSKDIIDAFISSQAYKEYEEYTLYFLELKFDNFQHYIKEYMEIWDIYKNTDKQNYDKKEQLARYADRLDLQLEICANYIESFGYKESFIFEKFLDEYKKKLAIKYEYDKFMQILKENIFKSS